MAVGVAEWLGPREDYHGIEIRRALRNEAKYAEAQKVLGEVRTLWTKYADRNVDSQDIEQDAGPLNEYAEAFSAQGDHLRSQRFFDRARDTEAKFRKLAIDHPLLAVWNCRAAKELLQAGKLDEAEKRCGGALDSVVKNNGSSYGLAIPMRLELAQMQIAAGHGEQAEKTVREALAELQQHDERPCRWQANAERLLGHCLRLQGRNDQAQKVWAEL